MKQKLWNHLKKLPGILPEHKAPEYYANDTFMFDGEKEAYIKRKKKYLDDRAAKHYNSTNGR